MSEEPTLQYRWFDRDTLQEQWRIELPPVEGEPTSEVTEWRDVPDFPVMLSKPSIQ